MEVLPVVLTSVLIVLALVLSIVGVQLFLVLMGVKKTLSRMNQAIDLAEEKLVSFSAPFQGLGGAVAGMKTGFKVFELFTQWLNRNKNKND
ncbi:MAG: hypothetical protein COY81_04840 [Candidatus Pacebacteria bacterium CG_4_10_14_0_8_um_filter_43_12]|nr:MAG: hypothetical protein COU66_03600 [Candidatus Pacebacteria bacterium CG10_big_fil_rev_8_21_14_0_10_44_11]PIY79014.1 MAG: hypothetical protein COY81_04840 [Candidatus Pacebacteria bacterium CG_4_10_14_0_8_um_filter_43_12]